MGWSTVPGDFVRGAWRRLPIETVAVLAAAAGASAAVHGVEHVWILRVLLGAVLVTPLAFAAHGRSRAFELIAGAGAAVVVMGALVLALPDVDAAGRESFVWPYGLALLAALLLPFVVAAPRFTGFVRRFFEQTTTWGLLWMVAMAAVGVVFAALHQLFHLQVERYVADLALVITGAFVLTWLHRLLPGAETPGRIPELWRRLATTIGAPFVAVMLVILVTYEIVVLVRGELPQNLLSPLIMAAGFVGFLCTLIISAVAGEPAGTSALAPADPHRFTRRLSIRVTAAFPLVLLALLPMAAWALLLRIDQYGLTPFRVVRIASLLCLGCLSLLGAVRWLRGRAPLSFEVPAVVIVFALATALGPASAVRLSIRSQSARLATLLDAAGVTDRRVTAEERPATVFVPAEQYEALQDALQGLADLGGAPALSHVLSGDLRMCTSRWAAYSCLLRLGVAQVNGNPEETERGETIAPFPEVSGKLIFFDAPRYGEPATVTLEGRTVTVTWGSTTARGQLDGLLAAWRGAGGTLPAQPVDLLDDKGALAGRLLVRTVVVSRFPGGPETVTSLSGAIVLPR